MTLWELTDELMGTNRRLGKLQCALLIRKWAREKAKEADSVDAYPFESQPAKEISRDFSDAIKDMLGVPEEDNG